MSVSAIHDLVRSGRATPAQGAMLLDLRCRLARCRRPLWVKAIEFFARVVFS